MKYLVGERLDALDLRLVIFFDGPTGSKLWLLMLSKGGKLGGGAVGV